jgi:exosortase
MLKAIGWRGGLILAALALLVGWAFWPSLAELNEIWDSDPQYSHGYLVPIFAVVLLWLRRDHCDLANLRPSLWGLGIVAFGCGLRLLGGHYFNFWLERFSLLPVIAGLVVTLGGMAAFRWSWPSLAFLIFMLPLPSQLDSQLSQPLQRVGTLASSYLLELLGYPAVAVGNVISMREGDINVVEACSGLRMLVTFFAAAAAVAIVSRQPLVIRILLFLSAAPIAVLVNVLRLTMTGILYESVSSEAAHKLGHDLAGWFMIPMALFFLWLTNLYLCRLFSFGSGEDLKSLMQTLPGGSARPRVAQT